MRVWLINPPVLRQRSGRIEAVISSMFYNSPPLGLASLAAVLERAGHRVRITDSPVEGLRASDLGAEARRQRPDLVGLTATTPYVDQAVAAAREVRRALSDRVPIGIGGPHVHANPQLLLEEPVFDLGVLGEGELTLLELVERLEAGRELAELADVPGVVSVREGALHRAPPRPLMEDLDALPLPARHLLPLERYVPLPNDEHGRPKTSAITSRGCPFDCTFCTHGAFGRRFRARSGRLVVEEMHHLEQTYGVRDIAFVDSCFTPSRKRVTEILEAMEASPPRASWTCSIRADALDRELLRRMRELGCWRVRFGIESGDDDVLRGIRKGVTREQIEASVRAADEVGLQVKAFFMVGHIGDTPRTIEETIRFATSLPLKDVTVQLNAPLPGTHQYEICRKHGTLIEEDPRRYSFFEPVFVPRGMTAAQLHAAHRSFYRRFYLRPALIWRHLREIRTPADLAKYLRAAPLVLNVMFTNR